MLCRWGVSRGSHCGSARLGSLSVQEQLSPNNELGVVFGKQRGQIRDVAQEMRFPR